MKTKKERERERGVPGGVSCVRARPCIHTDSHLRWGRWLNNRHGEPQRRHRGAKRLQTFSPWFFLFFPFWNFLLPLFSFLHTFSQRHGRYGTLKYIYIWEEMIPTGVTCEIFFKSKNFLNLVERVLMDRFMLDSGIPEMKESPVLRHWIR